MSTDSFTCFSDFPKEIRLLVWEASLRAPRLVSIRERRLKATLSEWAVMGFPDVLDPPYSSRNAEQRSSTAPPRGYGYITSSEINFWAGPVGLQFTTTDLSDLNERVTEYHDNGLMGIYSDSPMPGQLLACRKSNEVATKHYVPAFTITPALASTYFSFDRDILYLHSNLTSVNTFSWIPQSLRLLANTEELWKVKHLAIQVDKDLGGYDYLEEILADCLRHFGGVEKLTLVMVDHEAPNKTSELCLIDLVTVPVPSTIDQKCHVDATENCPALIFPFAPIYREDIEKYRLRIEDTRDGPSPWKVPDVIEYKAVVSEEVKSRILRSKVVLRPEHLYTENI